MLCPRCSMHMPGGSLVCARCGELTPHPTGLPFDTRPPVEGPRVPVSRDLPIDRRGRGVRAMGALGPMKVRPAPVQWAKGRETVPERRGRPPAPAPSAVHQAITDPQWLERPLPDAPVFEEPEPVETRTDTKVSLARRALAALVDAGLVLLSAVFATALGLVMFGWTDVAALLGQGFDEVIDGLLLGRELGLVLVGLLVVLGAAYSVLGHALGGATLGKRLVGLRVVDSDGEPPSLNVSFWRTAAACVSAALGGLGFALALFHPEGLSLHDHVVGTRVVGANES